MSISWEVYDFSLVLANRTIFIIKGFVLVKGLKTFENKFYIKIFYNKGLRKQSSHKHSILSL